MPTPPRVTWVGAKGLTRKGRGLWRVNAQDVNCTLRYEGPYDLCVSSAPLIGDVIAGYTAFDVKVYDWTVEEGEGSKGLLTILLRNPYCTAVISNPDFGMVGEPIPRLLYQPFRRRIESHPLCGTSSLLPGTGISTDSHIPQANYVPKDGGWNWNDYNKLIQGGMTEYDEKQPVLSLESSHYAVPQDVGADDFTIQDPDTLLQNITPAGSWKWLRNGDDLTRQEKLWRYIRSWTGFIPGPDYNSLFELLYDQQTS